jgi:hypothetical protein
VLVVDGGVDLDDGGLDSRYRSVQWLRRSDRRADRRDECHYGDERDQQATRV